MTTVIKDAYMDQLRRIVSERMSELDMDATALAVALNVVPREIVAFLEGSVRDLDIRTMSNLLYTLDMRPEVKAEGSNLTILLHRGR